MRKSATGYDVLAVEGQSAGASGRWRVSYEDLVKADAFTIPSLIRFAEPGKSFDDGVEIKVRARGGHAAQPHLSPDAILCAAQIVTAANTLVARRIEPNATAVLSLTRISGGVSHNVMPAEVSIMGTVRTFDGAVQDQLEAALREVVEGTARAAGCEASVEYHRYYPATINDADCAQHALDAARALLGEATLAPAPAFTSEDFAFSVRLRKRFSAFSPSTNRPPSVIFRTLACGGSGASSLNASAMATKKKALGTSGKPEKALPEFRFAALPASTASAFSTGWRDLPSRTSLSGRMMRNTSSWIE
jgi:hypothetical protein